MGIKNGDKINTLMNWRHYQSLRNMELKEMSVIQPEVLKNMWALYMQVSKHNVKGMKSNSISSFCKKTSGNTTSVMNSK